MNDFTNFEKTIVRELSCRLCLCTDVVKLKPLSAEVKRKIKRHFDIIVRADDNLPKAICHECLQQISAIHLYAVKVDKTQKFLEFHKMKLLEEKNAAENMHPIISSMSSHNVIQPQKTQVNVKTAPAEQLQGDTKDIKPNKMPKKKSAAEMKFLESMTLEEFANSEKVDRQLLATPGKSTATSPKKKNNEYRKETEHTLECLDPVVLIDGKPAKEGSSLDRQITLFYKMDCCICHENGFHFRSLMKHYKERHGIPGYVACCDKKFHYFYPKKIIEHMAYHLQKNIFQCQSCHQNFQTSQELYEHQSNGGRSEGKILCPRCEERYPTYRELGCHIITHRSEKNQCDYCGKLLKHHHRKKKINHMEDIILCSQCIRTLKSIEKQEKETKVKLKANSHNDTNTLQKHRIFKEAMGLSSEYDESTD